MPYAVNRGLHIHYTVHGSGPLVILQHDLLLNAASWSETELSMHWSMNSASIPWGMG